MASSDRPSAANGESAAVLTPPALLPLRFLYATETVSYAVSTPRFILLAFTAARSIGGRYQPTLDPSIPVSSVTSTKYVHSSILVPTKTQRTKVPEVPLVIEGAILRRLNLTIVYLLNLPGFFIYMIYPEGKIGELMHTRYAISF